MSLRSLILHSQWAGCNCPFAPMLQSPFWCACCHAPMLQASCAHLHSLGHLVPCLLRAALDTPAAVGTVATHAGKSTLLKSMAGRLKDSGLKLGGEITFNGFTLDSFIPERTAAYVSQNDNHMAGKCQQVAQQGLCSVWGACASQAKGR